MRVAFIRLALICFGLVFIAQMSTGISHADIDPNSVMGLWLFDEGQGDKAKDTSGNGNNGKIVGDVDEMW